MRKINTNNTDLVGRRFGKLTVLGDSGQRTGERSILWRCRCDCGGEILATRQKLVSGNAASCGCVPKQYASRREAEDLTGRQFGELTVIRRGANDKNNRVCWVCRCSCGAERTLSAIRLKSGHTRSCGCKRHSSSLNRRDLTGERFGRLLVVGEADVIGKAVWHCRCDCGKEVDVLSGNLLKGMTRSCGCWNREKSTKMHDHMHYQDDTCIERLERIRTDQRENKAGFRGLFLTKSGKYRVTITFRKVHYNLGYYPSFADAVRVRLEAESLLHDGYVNAFRRYGERAKHDPEWAENNPFYYDVVRKNVSAK